MRWASVVAVIIFATDEHRLTQIQTRGMAAVRSIRSKAARGLAALRKGAWLPRSLYALRALREIGTKQSRLLECDASSRRFHIPRYEEVLRCVRHNGAGRTYVCGSTFTSVFTELAMKHCS